MAKQSRKIQQRSQNDILLDEQMQAIDRAASDVRSGVIDDATYKSRIADVLATAENLDKARQGRLALRAAEAARVPMGSGSRGAIVLSGNRAVAPVLETTARPSAMLGGNIRVPVVRLPQQTMANPVADAVAAARVVGEQQAARSARVATAIPKVEAAVNKVRIPGYFGSSPAGTSPAVAEAVTRLRASKSPVQVARTGRAAMAAAEGAAASNAGKAVAGKGLLAAGGAGVMALLAAKIFGKKDQIDPQIQLALAQRMSQGQDNGAGTSKQLMDMSRALTIVKKLQDLAAVQGPAAIAKPRLI